MKRFVLLLCVISTPVLAEEQNAQFPKWLESIITSYQRSEPGIKAEIAKYQGNTVYYIPPRCCDIPSELYDKNGKLICHPDGGFMGGDGKCSTFKLEPSPADK